MRRFPDVLQPAGTTRSTGKSFKHFKRTLENDDDRHESDNHHGIRRGRVPFVRQPVSEIINRQIQFLEQGT